MKGLHDVYNVQTYFCILRQVISENIQPDIDCILCHSYLTRTLRFDLHKNVETKLAPTIISSLIYVFRHA
jgi:hypothetical protein